MSTTDIAVLFATDPLKHSEADIVAIIQKFREAKTVFATGVLKKEAKPAKAPAKKISLSDLGLGDL